MNNILNKFLNFFFILYLKVRKCKMFVITKGVYKHDNEYN